MRIREFSLHDLAAVLAIQGESPGAAQWAESGYRRLAEDPSSLIMLAYLDSPEQNREEKGAGGATNHGPRTTDTATATHAAGVVGFAAFHRVLDEAELRNMAVAPGYRRRGLGRALLDDAHRRLLKLGVRQVYLEVRLGNAPAIRLYESTGYRRHSIRKAYYQEPLEDACVMWIVLPGP